MKLKPNKKLNLGLEILRMIMSFWVILFHFYRPKNEFSINIIIRHAFHVPTFIIMSFYFLYPNLSQRNLEKIKNRLERLMIPYIIYPLLNWIIQNLLYILYNDERLKIGFTKLLMQLLIGRGLFAVLWFHFNLILITIGFYIISFLFKDNYLVILQILAFFAINITISNINYYYFVKYRDQIKFSVGYFAETIPLAVTGLTISSFDLINKIKYFRFRAITFSLAFLIILFKYNIFTKVKGFGKQGFMYIIGSSLFFILFSLFPLDNFNKFAKMIIRHITNFTAGIYMLHIKIFEIFERRIDSIKKHTFLGCIIIYLLSYLTCLIFYSLFKRSKIKYLFI